MLQELSFDEIVSIEGGTESPAYNAGHSIGKAVSAFLAAYGIYALFA